MPRLPLALVPYLLAFALIAGGYLWHAGDTLTGQAPAAGTVAIGGPFALTDQHGRPRSASDFRGRFMLIYFGYAMCPDVCPTELAAMGEALEKLGPKRNRIVPVFITIDPERDTPARLRPYLAAFGADFVGLTGPLATIKAVAASYRVYFKKQTLEGGDYAMDHSSVIYLMGSDGRFVTVYTEGADPHTIAADLEKRL